MSPRARYRGEEAVTHLVSNEGKIPAQVCTFELQGFIHVFLRGMYGVKEFSHHIVEAVMGIATSTDVMI
jgi:hypothetical protein